MELSQLKQYTEAALKLESAVNTQKLIMTEQESVINRKILSLKKPIEKQTFQKPQGPSYDYISESFDALNTRYWAIAMSAIGGMIVFFGLVLFSWISESSGYLWGGLFAIACGLALIRIGIKRYKKQEDEQQTKYQKQRERYEAEMAQYSEKVKNAENEYQKKVSATAGHLVEYQRDSSKLMAEHQAVLTTLTNALNKLYAQDIIFPKYRNLVAIASIYEYLASGRCDKLEGSDGAYNLYEMELRQNIVIGQLSRIINNLERIKMNQYALYQELQQTNALVNKIVVNTDIIRSSSIRTAYFTEITAKAAVWSATVF